MIALFSDRVHAVERARMKSGQAARADSLRSRVVASDVEVDDHAFSYRPPAKEDADMTRFEFALKSPDEIRQAGVVQSESFSDALSLVSKHVSVQDGDTLEIGVAGFPPARFECVWSLDEGTGAWKPAGRAGSAAPALVKGLNENAVRFALHVSCASKPPSGVSPRSSNESRETPALRACCA